VLCDSADIGIGAAVHESARVWHLAQIRDGATIEAGVVVGRGAYIGSGVRIGKNSKIQNFALVYEPAVIGAGVFIGPAAILTNDQRPRAVNPNGTLKSANDWEPVGVVVLEGASIGARAVCVAPVTVGSWSMVAAGAVVVTDVPDFALVVGVPARRIGWVGRSGSRLEKVEGSENLWVCPVTSVTFREVGSDELVELADSAGEL